MLSAISICITLFDSNFGAVAMETLRLPAVHVSVFNINFQGKPRKGLHDEQRRRLYAKAEETGNHKGIIDRCIEHLVYIDCHGFSDPVADGPPQICSQFTRRIPPKLRDRIAMELQFRAPKHNTIEDRHEISRGACRYHRAR